MKKIFFYFLFSCTFLFAQNLKAQEASAEMRENSKLVEKISFRELSEIKSLKSISEIKIPKNELPRIAILPLEKQQNLTKQQLKTQRNFAKIEKFASSKTGKWLIKKLVKIQLKKELRKELRKVKGNKEAQKIFREKYAKKQTDLSTTINTIVSIIGLIGSILVLISNSTQISFWIGIGMMVLGLIMLCIQLLR
jgi:Ca2+/Na+ antiporter